MAMCMGGAGGGELVLWLQTNVKKRKLRRRQILVQTSIIHFL